MARAAGMKLISRRREKTTAGRWRRTALTTAACPFRRPGQDGAGDRASPVCLAGLTWSERDGLYAAQTFPQWQQKLFIGALKETSLIVLAVDGNQVREEERLLEARGKRIRDVRVGPDGYLYVLTDESNGELLRLSPES